MGKVFGYVRVSTKDQNLERQKNSLIDFGVDDRDIYEDEKTGKNFEREGYQWLKKSLRSGDTLVVHELDRLGRNKRDTLKEIQYFKDNGIRLKALNIPTTLIDYDDNLMLETINNIVIELYTMMAQQELETREKRQREGINSMPIDEATGKRKSLKKGKGLMGRPAATFPPLWDMYYLEWKENKITAKQFMEHVDLKRTTFYKLVKQYEGENN